MRTKVIFILLIFSQGFLLLTVFPVFRSAVTGRLPAAATGMLRDGDLVFRRGRSLESMAVVFAGRNKGFSHVGILVMEAGKPYVIHIEPGNSSLAKDAVRKEPLESFLEERKASHYAIYRSHLGRKSLERVVDQARSYYIRKCRFDNAYDLQTDRDLYCTELVLKAFQRGDPRMTGLLRNLESVNVLVASRKVLMPGAFMASDLFFRICSN
jgi:hypothetical protein